MAHTDYTDIVECIGVVDYMAAARIAADYTAAVETDRIGSDSVGYRGHLYTVAHTNWRRCNHAADSFVVRETDKDYSFALY